MTKVLITGINGFAGSYLAEYALSKGAEVWGTIRWRSSRANIKNLDIHLVECDLRYFPAPMILIKKAQPDLVFHLAALAHPTSWSVPIEALESNITSQVNLLESIRLCQIDPCILIAGSAEEYGLVYDHELPIKETNPLRPLTPYAVSKVAQDLLGFQYYKSYGMKIVRTRAFTQTGPKQPDTFVTSNFSKQITQIEKGLIPPVISVGNLESRRDFSDVKDIVRGYWLALEKCELGEVYNISSGISWKMKEVLSMLLHISGVKAEIKEDVSKLRPSDPTDLRGDSSKFRERTGWKPEIPLMQTLDNLLQFWRDQK